MASNKNKALYICYFGLREPLVQTQVVQYLREIAKLAALGVADLALTTNAALLAEQAGALRAAGLRRLNASLDSLDPQRFRQITQRGELRAVLAGLAAAKAHGFGPIKINAVVQRGVVHGRPGRGCGECRSGL